MSTETQAEPKISRNAKVTFVGNPLKVLGIIFNHSHPLDLSITKYCYQNCSFCFANLNRKAIDDVIGKNEDPTDMFLRMLDKANGPGYNPQNIKEWCLHHKYPVVFSNNVDPFMPESEIQFRLGERVLEACLLHNQKLYIQTKEVYPNEKVRELLIKGKDLFQVYVSISTLDYATAKKYETIRVTPEQRLQRIRDLSDHGVNCVIALNPYVPEWQPDLRSYFKAAAASGAKWVMADPLHFSSSQKKAASKERLGNFLDRKTADAQFPEDCKIMEKAAKEFGIGFATARGVGDNGTEIAEMWPNETDVWPIDAEGLFNEIHEIWEEEKTPVQVTWADVDAYYSRFKEWRSVFNLNEFAGVLWTDNESYFMVKSTLGAKNTIRNIVRLAWNNPEKMDMFQTFYNEVYLLVDSEGCEGDKVDDVYDDNGDLMYVYDPLLNHEETLWDQHKLLESRGLIALEDSKNERR